MTSINDSPEQLKRAESIFHEVLAAPGDQRDSLLEDLCQGDSQMIDELKALVESSMATVLQIKPSSEKSDSDHSRSGLPFQSIGPYELDRLLGRGGMGAVYLAHRADGEFRKQVAIKLIDRHLATDPFRQQFRRERQILAELVHPYIARLLDGGVSEAGDPYLVMEYVDGISILRYCQEHSLRQRDRLLLFKRVCEAVQFAHQNLVVHRDLKADNILVAADGTPRLLDFGTAKLLAGEDSPAGELTRQGIHPFTPQYASPEQVLGKTITTASDIYSLGVLLFAMLTDARPYRLKEFSTEEMLELICTTEPPRPSSVATTAEPPDADLDAIILKTLRKAPEDRYITVEQLAADIQSYLDGLPVLARRGNLQYRAGKFIRRNKLALAGVAVLILTILAGITGILWQSHQKDIERRRAEARSADLRQLSNSLLSEIDGAVKELPGSTPVQQLLVNRVLEHLDSMSKDASGDRVTQLDLVNAYTRLGNLQGNPYEQNIGDATGALVSLNKALAIAQSLQSSNPNDPAVLGALATVQKARSNVLFGISHTTESIVAMRAAIDAFNAEFALQPPNPAQLAEAAGAYNGLGDQLGLPGVASIGDSAGALQAFRQAVELSRRALVLDPKFTRSSRTVAIGLAKIGDIVIQTDPQGAVEDFRKSLAAWSALADAGDTSATTRRGIARVYLKLGYALSATRDYKASIAAFDQSEPTLRRYASLDPKDTRAQTDLFALDDNEAKTLVDMLHPELDPGLENRQQIQHRAVSLLQDSMAILDKLLQLDHGNRIWIANLAYDKADLGTLLQSGGDHANGAQLAAAGIGSLLQLAAAPNASMDELDLATSAALAIRPAGLRNPDTTTRLAERLVALDHRRNPSYLLTLAQAYRAQGQPARAAATAQEALSLLPPATPGSPSSRTRRLLELESHP